MVAIELLSEVIALGAKASAFTFRERPGFPELLRHGYIREMGFVQSVVCEECDWPHDAELVFDTNRYGYFCPTLGFLEPERASLTGLYTDLQAVVSGLANAFGCKRCKSSPVHGETWRIGALPSEGGDISLYLHPTLLDEKDAMAVLSALAREVSTPYSLVLTAAGTLPLPNTKTVLLSDVIGLAPDQSGFSVLSDPREIVEVPRKNPGGAPNRYKGILEPLIQSRIEDGSALLGRNEEAQAIQSILNSRDTIDKMPSLPSIKSYVTKARAGE
ncbi:hypothetical protein [Pseudovibrio sp. Alg231-02]|uniref:hypothetical protein n=1 Tax=Pseudovibrio sp. Alg231-02 TaxID=1922223 RepID=UPI000D55017C|nr:hypothetical protein [Pseudovibrio sp. Alg231-02]